MFWCVLRFAGDAHRAATYSFFDKGSPSARALATGAVPSVWFLRWGKGGHLFIAGGLLVACMVVLRSAPPGVLFLEDQGKAKGKSSPAEKPSAPAAAESPPKKA